MEKETVEEVTVKPTWRLAWGLYWRQLLIGLALVGVGVAIAIGLGFIFLERWLSSLGG